MTLIAAALTLIASGTLAYASSAFQPLLAQADSTTGSSSRSREVIRLVMRLVGGTLILSAAVISSVVLASGTLS